MTRSFNGMMALSVIVMFSGPHLRAAFCNVAIANTVWGLQLRHAIARVERVHLESGRVDEVARSHELIEQMMIPQDVTYILAEKAFDAFAKFLHPLDVRLNHPPRSIRCVRRPREKRLDRQLCPKVP